MGTLNVNTIAAPAGTTNVSNPVNVSGGLDTYGIDDQLTSASSPRKIVVNLDTSGDNPDVLINGDLKVSGDFEVTGSVKDQSSNSIWARWSGHIDLADPGSSPAQAAVSGPSTTTSSGLAENATVDTASPANLKINFKPSVDADDYTVIVTISGAPDISVYQIIKNQGSFKVGFWHNGATAASGEDLSNVKVDIIMAV